MANTTVGHVSTVVPWHTTNTLFVSSVDNLNYYQQGTMLSSAGIAAGDGESAQQPKKSGWHRRVAKKLSIGRNRRCC